MVEKSIFTFSHMIIQLKFTRNTFEKYEHFKNLQHKKFIILTVR
jgi:hypothetical protein